MLTAIAAGDQSSTQNQRHHHHRLHQKSISSFFFAFLSFSTFQILCSLSDWFRCIKLNDSIWWHFATNCTVYWMRPRRSAIRSNCPIYPSASLWQKQPFNLVAIEALVWRPFSGTVELELLPTFDCHLRLWDKIPSQKERFDVLKGIF